MKKLTTKTLAIIFVIAMVLSSFVGTFTITVGAEEASPIENLFYPLMMHRYPGPNIEYGIAGVTPSGSVDDWTDSLQWRLAGRAFPVGDEDTIYFTQSVGRDGVDPFFKYDAQGKLIGGASNGYPTDGETRVDAVKLDGTEFKVSGETLAIFKYEIPDGKEIAYIAPSLITVPTLLITKNREFTVDEYKAYWASFNYDANIKEVKDSVLKDKTALFIGDGFISGINDYWKPSNKIAGIAGRIAKATGMTVKNAAASYVEIINDGKGNYVASEIDIEYGSKKVNGITTSISTRTQFEAHKDDADYDYVVIGGGSIAARINTKNYADQFKALVATIRESMPNAKVVFVTNTDISGYSSTVKSNLPNVYSAIKTACGELKDCIFVDLYNNSDITDVVNPYTSKYLPDGLNPTSDVYDLVYPYVMAAMESCEPITENLFYPLMAHRYPGPNIEYGIAGVTPSGSVDDWTDPLTYRMSGRAFPVEGGDVIYYTENTKRAERDPFFKYDAQGKLLIEGEVMYDKNKLYVNGTFTDGYANINTDKYRITGQVVETFTVGVETIGIFRYEIPKDTEIAYIAPSLTTDLTSTHLITKNRPFTKAQYDAYWKSFDYDANIEEVADSTLEGKTALFIGDGFISGANDYWKPSNKIAGIAGRIAKATGMTVVNAAAKYVTNTSGAFTEVDLEYGGDNSTRKQFEARKDDADYDFVVIGGGNVAARTSVGQTTYANQFKSLVATIRENMPNAKVVFVTNTDISGYSAHVKEKLPLYYSEIKKACGELEDCIFVDLYNNLNITSVVSPYTSKYLPDGLHPTSDAYDLIYPYVMAAMESCEPITDNLFYPLLMHHRPGTTLEYGIEGVTPSADVYDVVVNDDYRVAGRAFAVTPGDVLYYTDGQASSNTDAFVKYDSNGKLVEVTVTPTFVEQISSGNSGINIYYYVIPEGVSYVAPHLVTDSLSKHVITKNVKFNKVCYDDYWRAYNYDAAIVKKENSPLKDKTALVLGDTFAYGIADYLAPSNNIKGFAGRIALATGLKVTYAMPSITDMPLNGQYAEPGIAYNPKYSVLEQFKPYNVGGAKENDDFDYVIISAGINDVRGLGATDRAAKVKEALATLAADIRASMPDVKIVYIAQMHQENQGNSGKNMRDYYGYVKTKCLELGIAYIDLYNNTELNEALDVNSSKYFPRWDAPTSDAYDMIYPYVLKGLEAVAIDNKFEYLMQFTRPGDAYDVTPNASVNDLVINRNYRVSGKAFAVKPGDTLYYTNGYKNDKDDPFYKYNSAGELLDTLDYNAYGNIVVGSDYYVEPTKVAEISAGNNGIVIYSYIVPEGVSYVAPMLTTDSQFKHIITVNRPFTAEDYNVYNSGNYKVSTTQKVKYSSLKNLKALFVGDNTMFGLNDNYPTANGIKGFAGRIAEATGMTVVNAAAGSFKPNGGPGYYATGFIVGNEGETIIEQFNAQTDTDYDVVVIYGGIEDVKAGKTVDEVGTAYKALIDAVKEKLPNATIFYVSGFRYDSIGMNVNTMNAYWTEIENISDENGVVYVDLYNDDGLNEKLVYQSSVYVPNGINPTSEGYDIITPYITIAMEEEMAHTHATDRVDFYDDSVSFFYDTCGECAGLPANDDVKVISSIVKNGLSDVQSGYGVIKLAASSDYWFVTDALIDSKVADGNLITVGDTVILTVKDGKIMAGEAQLGDASVKANFQIAIEFYKNLAGENKYNVYIDGILSADGDFEDASVITLGDKSFKSFVSFYTNRAVTIGAEAADEALEYTDDKYGKLCVHTDATAAAADRNIIATADGFKYVYLCDTCGEKVYADISIDLKTADGAAIEKNVIGKTGMPYWISFNSASSAVTAIAENGGNLEISLGEGSGNNFAIYADGAKGVYDVYADGEFVETITLAAFAESATPTITISGVDTFKVAAEAASFTHKVLTTSFDAIYDESVLTENYTPIAYVKKDDATLNLLYATNSGELAIDLGDSKVILTDSLNNPLVLTDVATEIAIVYDDENGTVRYYVGGNVAYCNEKSAVNIAVVDNLFFNIASEKDALRVNAAIATNVKTSAVYTDAISKFVGFQENVNGQIRLLTGVNGDLFDGVGYVLETYDAEGTLINTTTVEDKAVYDKVVADGVDVYATDYGFDNFLLLKIDGVDLENSVGYKVIATPYAKTGDKIYEANRVTILITEEGYKAYDHISFRAMTANIGDFTGNTTPNVDPAVIKATYDSVGADIIATQEDKPTIPGGLDVIDTLYSGFKYRIRTGTGDYNYKGYMSNYKLLDTKQVYYEVSKEEQGCISHPWFYYTMIEIDGIEVSFIDIHVDWCCYRAREEQFRFILNYIEENQLEYAVIIGDYNPDPVEHHSHMSAGSTTHDGYAAEEIYKRDIDILHDYGFTAANADKFEIRDTTMDSVSISPCDNIAVSSNMNLMTFGLAAEEWSNDHAFVYADIEILVER